MPLLHTRRIYVRRTKEVSKLNLMNCRPQRQHRNCTNSHCIAPSNTFRTPTPLNSTDLHFGHRVPNMTLNMSSFTRVPPSVRSSGPRLLHPYKFETPHRAL